MARYSSVAAHDTVIILRVKVREIYRLFAPLFQ
jgi:hypothetical protein